MPMVAVTRKNALYRDSAGDTRGAAQTWHSRLPVAWHNSTWTADRAASWLRQHDNREPFCAWVSFPDPHHPFDCPEPWSRLHDPADVDLPRYRRRDFKGRPWWHEAVLTSEPTGSAKSAGIRKKFSRIPEQSDEQLREIIANTYGQIALIDHGVGRMLIALEEAGLAENTIVIYLSDHGDWLGDHGLILKGPMHYEGLLRVPLIMRGPGIPAATDQRQSGLHARSFANPPRLCGCRANADPAWFQSPGVDRVGILRSITCNE